MNDRVQELHAHIQVFGYWYDRYLEVHNELKMCESLHNRANYSKEFQVAVEACDMV